MIPSQFTVLAPHYDELMQVVPYRDWVEYLGLLWGIVEHEPRRVLDCACGTGNVSFEMARNGYDVTGVDLSEGMIEVARAKIADVENAPRFERADLTNFDLGETFDSATCLYDSLNYILEPADLQTAFASIARHIEPGGIFIFDMNTELALETELFTQRNRDPRRNLHYEWNAQYDEKTRVCTVSMNFQRKAPDGTMETFDEVHREYAYSLTEIKAMLDATNWELLRNFDAYTINPPHRRSERWYFVARREV